MYSFGISTRKIFIYFNKSFKWCERLLQKQNTITYTYTYPHYYNKIDQAELYGAEDLNSLNGVTVGEMMKTTPQ